MKRKNIGIILAGGVGSRFGSDIPKQYQLINGKEVISYVIDAFRKSSLTDKIIIVAGEKYVDSLQNKYGITTIKGGAVRNETVYNALHFIRENYPNCDKVIFADSARPMLTSQYIDKVFGLLDEYDSVITVAQITDSLAYRDEGLVDRNDYKLIQTPESFKLTALDGFNADNPSTAIMQQCKSKNIFYCDDLKYNLKITYPKDILIASALLEG